MSEIIFQWRLPIQYIHSFYEVISRRRLPPCVNHCGGMKLVHIPPAPWHHIPYTDNDKHCPHFDKFTPASPVAAVIPKYPVPPVTTKSESWKFYIISCGITQNHSRVFLHLASLLSVFSFFFFHMDEKPYCFLLWDRFSFRCHHDTMTCKCFPHYWSFVRGNQRASVDPLTKCQKSRTLVFFMPTYTRCWTNHPITADLRHHDLHVMSW